MQLDLFLRSFLAMVKDAQNYYIQILCTYSNEEYQRGYEKLLNKNYPLRLRCCIEISFKQDLLNIIETDYPHTVFFVDDDVFIRKIDFYDRQMDIFMGDGRILCRSLRMHPHLSYCYPARKRMLAPYMTPNNVWRWIGASVDYGYPMSVDGHIFRTADLYPLLVGANYSNPNTLEGALVPLAPTSRPNMICYDKSIIINNPLNRVQNVNNNVCGNITTDYLNEQFLDNKIISLTPFMDYNNKACHEEIPITLINEGDSN